MQARLHDTGPTFKGLTTYLLTPKRGQKDVLERVAWTATRNLSPDPFQAWREMAALAKKASARRKARGLDMSMSKSVVHLVLAWPPREERRPSRAAMLVACDEALELLKANGHQALIVAHHDTPSLPHVHLAINRYHPDTYKVLSLYRAQRRLDAWVQSKTPLTKRFNAMRAAL